MLSFYIISKITSGTFLNVVEMNNIYGFNRKILTIKLYDVLHNIVLSDPCKDYGGVRLK